MDNEVLIAVANKHLAHTSKPEVLEIGCGDGSVLFDLFRETTFDYHRLKGVDHVRDRSIREDLETAYYDTAFGDFKMPKENLFQFQVEDGLTYLNAETRRYDLIVFSNYLHFFSMESIIEQIESALRLLKQNGIIYIKMVNENKDNSEGIFKTVYTKSLQDEIFFVSSGVEFINGDYHCHLVIHDLRPDVEANLKVYLPSIFPLLESRSITKEQWKTINSNLGKHFKKTRKAFLANNSFLQVETNFFTLLTAAVAGNEMASRLMGFIDAIFQSLNKSLGSEEKEKITNTIYSILVSLDHKYLNYIGELSVLASLVQDDKIVLLGVEDCIINKKTADFKILNTEDSSVKLFEVLNIHINGTENLHRLLGTKIMEKLKDKTACDMDSKPFGLVPVVWGQYSDLRRLEALYKSGKGFTFQNVTEPYAYCVFFGGDRKREYRFKEITKLFEGVDLP